MRKIGFAIAGLLALALLFLVSVPRGDHAALTGSLSVNPAHADAGAGTAAEAGGAIARSFGVGGVLTRDGQLWQYRPDQDRWLGIDEAFREEGRETHVVPLPVGVAEIAEMESFGFLVTQAGEAWLYEFTTDAWRKLPAPPEKR
ncbi:MAG: hypothetical protein KAY32_04795 [Candidatus Eisenbacteria sp.]|nr:hypothetical protein [Candidatus Eisenbacteria bacterium]